MSRDPDRRSRFRRPPSVHRRPATPAPETPEEVLERAPDVSRETQERDLEAAAWAALRDRPVPDAQLLPVDEEPPPLGRAQVARLEALTARWVRDVRLEGPADATLLYQASPPPPPPRRARLELADTDETTILTPELARAVVEGPAPDVDAAQAAERSRQLLEEEAAEEALAARRTPAPVPPPGPPAAEPERALPARVSDWASRHDQRSLEFPVRERLARAVPLADVSLEAGPVLDQGTTPPLTPRDASACVGMACIAAAHVLKGQYPLAYDVEPFDEEDARQLYRRAQELDQVHGQDYAGTSVLAGMKAGQEAGLWDGYLWALGGTRDVAQVLLQLRVAVVVGVPWSTSLEEPDRFGIIRPGGIDNGGHALAVVGLRLGMLGGSPGPWFELQQSRGPAEGIGGRVYLHHTALRRLLASPAEAAVPLPASLLE